jgi:predicted transcriptional regulator
MPPQVDFRQLMRDLRQRDGLSCKDIARLADISRSGVFNYETGSTPLYPAGDRVIRLWCEKLG